MKIWKNLGLESKNFGQNKAEMQTFSKNRKRGHKSSALTVNW